MAGEEAKTVTSVAVVGANPGAAAASWPLEPWWP
jgi:hypothetical protein